MTPQLEVVWSGAKERAGEAGGLSSPLIGSAARLCMELGGHQRADAPLKPAYTPRKVITCWSCRKPFERQFVQSSQHLKRVCDPCRERILSPVWR